MINRLSYNHMNTPRVNMLIGSRLKAQDRPVPCQIMNCGIEMLQICIDPSPPTQHKLKRETSVFLFIVDLKRN